MAEHLGQLVPKRLVLPVHWVLPEKVLPRGMGELVLMDGGQTGPVWIQVQPTRRAGARGEEESLRTVTASTLVGSGVRDAGESGLRLPAAGMERAETTTSRNPGANRSICLVTASVRSSVDPFGTWA